MRGNACAALGAGASLDRRHGSGRGFAVAGGVISGVFALMKEAGLRAAGLSCIATTLLGTFFLGVVLSDPNAIAPGQKLSGRAILALVACQT